LALFFLPATALAGVEAGAHAAATSFFDEDWRPQRSQSPLGAYLRWGREAWPVEVEIRVDHERTRDQNTLALPVGHVAHDLLIEAISGGVVWSRRAGAARPFAGGGVEALRYRRCLFDNDFGPGGRVCDRGLAPGLYASGGVAWRVGGLVLGLEGRLRAGAAAKLSLVEVDPGVSFRLRDEDVSTARREIALRIGWRRDGSPALAQPFVCGPPR
jgi:hypothetical protein